MKMKDRYQRNRGAQEMTEPAASVAPKNATQDSKDKCEDRENTRKENEKLNDEKISEYGQTVLENNVYINVSKLYPFLKIKSMCNFT